MEQVSSPHIAGEKCPLGVGPRRGDSLAERAFACKIKIMLTANGGSPLGGVFRIDFDVIVRKVTGQDFFPFFSAMQINGYIDFMLLHCFL